MNKLVAVSAIAAVTLFAGAANAAMYIVTDPSGQKYLVSDDNTRTPLLLGTADAAPGNCQAGFYYQAGNNRILSCGGGAAFMTAPVPPGSVMADGQPFPAGSLMVQSLAGAVDDTGTNKRGNNNAGPGSTGSISGRMGDPGGPNPAQ